MEMEKNGKLREIEYNQALTLNIGHPINHRGNTV